MARYRKKPVVIEAEQWFSLKNLTKVVNPFPATEKEKAEGIRCQHCGGHLEFHGWVKTLEGGHIVCPGDWIITGVKGERYPCKPDIFDATYDPLKE